MIKTYEINSRIIKFKPHKFEGKLSVDEYKNQIYSALLKIGVEKSFIEIEYSSKEDVNSYAVVTWIINKKIFKFKCDSQETFCSNLGAIAQAIQEDIRQVTRGIKDLFLLMNQYEVEDKKFGKKGRKNLISFNKYSQKKKEQNSNIDNLFSFEENSMDYFDENWKLEEQYLYLLKYTKEQLDKMYFRLKDQCIMQNKPNHPMLKALKIVRHKKGLNL